ncbi:MAG: hypothetical protein ABJC26_04575 [Gemmatimonadaceae bacterium]
MTARITGIPLSERPLRYTLYVTGTSVSDNPYLDSVSVTSNDTIAALLVSKLLPSNGLVNFRVRVTKPGEFNYDSPILGPYQAPQWLKLIAPIGSIDTRRPTFVWSSAKIDPAFGFWKYNLQILNNNSNGKIESSTGGLIDTTFTPSDTLHANTSYTWQVQASLTQHGEKASAVSPSAFIISDASLPTTNLLYQNFPNPFPSPTAFFTCFWFDIGAAGGTVSLDVLDLRGNLVRNIITPQQFSRGTFGRGASGTGSLCDDRYVWDGTATTGRTVPRGIYLLRLIVSGSPPTYKKILFLGR